MLSSSPPTLSSRRAGGLGRVYATAVKLDEECELVSLLTIRVNIEDAGAKALFQNQATPSISQKSPCVMTLGVGRHSQDVSFPFPVIGSQNSLGLARTSLYIEIRVPPSGPFKPDGLNYNPFPLTRSAGMTPWNIHHLNPSRLPTLRVQADNQNLAKWFRPHVTSMFSKREVSMKTNNEQDPLVSVKTNIRDIMVLVSGVNRQQPIRVFSLVDDLNSDTVLFVNDLKFDLPSHTLFLDAYVLTTDEDLMSTIRTPFFAILDAENAKGTQFGIALAPGGLRLWKHLLPAIVERGRTTWTHTANCEYATTGTIPLSEEADVIPICSCGRGKDVDGMKKDPLWAKMAPYVTRVALSPLFSVSFLEPIIRAEADRRCSVCRKKGRSKLKKCKTCQVERYCSVECQSSDWGSHRSQCRPPRPV